MPGDFFHKQHSEDALAIVRLAFPEGLRGDVDVMMGKIAPSDIEPHVEWSQHLETSEGRVTIPYRVYFPEVPKSAVDGLTKTQAGMLAAVMTRSSSGFQREAWLRVLLKSPSAWAVPFVALSMGDYVREIPTAVEQGLTVDWEALFNDFLPRNPQWLMPLSQRILTYWDIYYRSEVPRLTEYPGYRAALRLGLWDKKVARRMVGRHVRWAERLKQADIK